MDAAIFEARAMRLAEQAVARPHTAPAALKWLDMAVAMAFRNHDERLAETLGDHAGTVRAAISRYRREDYSMCYTGMCRWEDRNGECRFKGPEAPCERGEDDEDEDGGWDASDYLYDRMAEDRAIDEMERGDAHA